MRSAAARTLVTATAFGLILGGCSGGGDLPVAPRAPATTTTVEPPKAGQKISAEGKKAKTTATTSGTL
jgi:hypothetical protein